MTDKSVTVGGDSTLSDLLDLMIRKYGIRFKKIAIDPETNQVSSSICILVNGKIANTLQERLKEGDEITLFIPVSGG